MTRVVGIDFSGSASAWRTRCARPCVWIAQAELRGGSMVMTDLRPVQDLASDFQRPFDRLADWLARLPYPTGIDAPTSVPDAYFGSAFRTHRQLLRAVDQLRRSPDFPTGCDLLHLVGEAGLGRKRYRQIETLTRVATRSTTWNGPRPGAPFTAACLKLLARSRRPVWPWCDADRHPVMEVFPAAQMRHWNLPHTRYADPAAGDVRDVIIEGLVRAHRLIVTPAQARLMNSSADALDAVVCCYGVKGAIENRLAIPLPAARIWRREGWIAIHA